MKKGTIGLAGEYAVASELCRRDVYAQLTLGNLKRTDIIIYDNKTDKMLRIEVKSKMGKYFPNCKGIYGKNVYLVFVDFKDKELKERPNFYILTVKEWKALVLKDIEIQKKKGRKVVMNEKNESVYVDQINKYGKPYIGLGIKPEDIKEHHEAWDKIVKE